MPESKKNILFVNGHLQVGGVERSLVDAICHLNYDKYDVDLLLLEGKGEYFHELPKEVNIIYKPVGNAYGPLLKVLYKCVKNRDYLCLVWRIAIILSQIIGGKMWKIVMPFLGLKKNYSAAIAYRECTAPMTIVANAVSAECKICWWHFGGINPTTDTSMLLKTWSSFDKIVGVSNSVKQFLEELSSELQNKLCVVPNMIDAERIKGLADDENPYKDDNMFKIVSVTRIEPEKNPGDIIEAAKMLVAERIGFKWYIIGDGSLFDGMKRSIEQSRLQNNIIMLGRKANPYPWVKYADLFVHTSHVESQGLVIQEAMTIGTPCVVARSEGPSEYIEDGVNGIMAKPTVESLVMGIKRAIENAELRKTISENAKTSLAKIYSPEVVIEIIENLINK